jgi:hypothetical protein
LIWFAPILLATIWLNNRRIAWVGLGAVFLAVCALARPGPARRALARVAIFGLPLFLAYLAAGWGSEAGAFKPVASLRTIVASDQRATTGADSSTRAREIENFNLSRTLRQHPWGTGLGHEYEEVVKGPDIAQDFAQYRYIPHNSVLWMLSVGGPVGFFLLWSLFATGIYLAARAHRLARSADERMAALAAISAQLLFLIQAFGDMGTQNWSTTWLVAAALTVSGKLAIATGAWPSAETLALAQEPAC